MSNTEEIKAVVRRTIEEVWNQGKLEIIDEIFSPDLVFHDVDADFHGYEGIKQYVLGFRNAFPDLNITIEDQIAEDDKEATRLKWTGTHKGELKGIPPTGSKIFGAGICIHRIVDGKIAEVWRQADNFKFLQQLGVIPDSK